jgi:hypothetical protein
LCYERSIGGNRVIVLLNFGASDQVAEAQEFAGMKIVMSTHGRHEGQTVKRHLQIAGNEGLILGPAA